MLIDLFGCLVGKCVDCVSEIVWVRREGKWEMRGRMGGFIDFRGGRRRDWVL
jgi:hypothetical protein